MANAPFNFADSLDVSSADVEAPPILPVGVYNARIVGPGAIDARDNIAPPAVHDSVIFNCQPTEAVEVDEDAVEAFGDLSGAFFRVEFLGKQGDPQEQKRLPWQVKRFLVEHCGMDDAPLGELIANAKGAEFQVVIDHQRSKKNPDSVFVRARRTAPVV